MPWLQRIAGMAYLKLESVARGLGFTETAASGNECIRWRNVQKYLEDLGIAGSCDGNLPEFIPENIFYRLAMKAKNETAGGLGENSLGCPKAGLQGEQTGLGTV